MTDDNGYSRKCAGYDDRQPSILTKDQYERMREIYEDDPIFWIIYPLEGDRGTNSTSWNRRNYYSYEVWF
jgi:hypothetical protein